MPNAIVATITTDSPERNRVSATRFSIGDSPAWNGIAACPAVRRLCATRSVLLRLPQYTIPACPGWRLRKAASWALSPAFGWAAMCKLDRWNEAANTSASAISNALQDVGARPGIGRRRQRDARHAREIGA